MCVEVESPPLGSSNTTIVGRITRTFGSSQCNVNNAYPGSIGSSERYYEEIGPFRNPFDNQACATVTVNLGTCTLNDAFTLVRVAAFIDFNASEIGQGYLGDVVDDDFSFDVPPNGEFVVVGQQIRDINATDNGNDCIFSVLVSIGDSCL